MLDGYASSKPAPTCYEWRHSLLLDDARRLPSQAGCCLSQLRAEPQLFKGLDGCCPLGLTE
jgi:hypothetical protein